MVNEEENLLYLQEQIRYLEDVAHTFVKKIGEPPFITQRGKERFRHSHPDSRHFQVLKAVRVISALHASVTLYRAGHLQDIGNLFRTIHECLTEIDFVQEAHETGQPTEDQKRIVDLFFAKDLKTTEELMATKPQIFKVPRKKIRASAARKAVSYEDPQRFQRIYEVLDDAWSGYTHAEYPQIMELYEGNLEDGTGSFRMRDMLDTPRMRHYRWQLASFIMNAINRSIIIARNLGFPEIGEELLERRKQLEVSPSYMDHP